MIAGIFHKGSGLGNQLHRYVMTRVIAKRMGVNFGMIYPENFKGASFMNLDMGIPVKGLLHEFNEEKMINEQGNDVRDYDWRVHEIQDNTLIDGEFQGEKYYSYYLDDIREWLKPNHPNLEDTDAPDDLCIINFRGGEYVGISDLFLPHIYWTEAIAKMREINPNMRFQVETDDVLTADQFFPDFYIAPNDMALNWMHIRKAKYLILSNSSFAILPALLNQNAQEIIAPKYWAGYNKGYWQLEQNRYSKFNHIHHED